MEARLLPARPAAPATALSTLDRWGMVVSSLCLIHCLALPLVAAFLPLLAVPLAGDEWVHSVLLAIALPVSGMALVRGFRAHRAAGPAILGAFGLAGIACAIVVRADMAERILTVAGGLLVARAHWLNWKSHHRRG